MDNMPYSLKGGCKVFSHVFIVKVMATVSWHVLHLPAAPTVLCQLPEFQLIWKVKMVRVCVWSHSFELATHLLHWGSSAGFWSWSQLMYSEIWT